MDYTSLDRWLPGRGGASYFHAWLREGFSLANQSDAYKCALLKNYGGVFLDADTIITKDAARRLWENDAPITQTASHCGFIAGKKGAALFVKWEYYIRRNIRLHYYCHSDKSFVGKLLQFFCPPLVKILRRCLERWDILANWPLEKAVRRFTPLWRNRIRRRLESFGILPRRTRKSPAVRISHDRMTTVTFPEEWCQKLAKLAYPERYQQFYFEMSVPPEQVLENNDGIIMLHNSWTPSRYRNMDRQEFLEQDNTMSNLLRRLLELPSGEGKRAL